MRRQARSGPVPGVLAYRVVDALNGRRERLILWWFTRWLGPRERRDFKGGTLRLVTVAGIRALWQPPEDPTHPGVPGFLTAWSGRRVVAQCRYKVNYPAYSDGVMLVETALVATNLHVYPLHRRQGVAAAMLVFLLQRFSSVANR